MPLYLGKWGFDEAGNIKYTLDHYIGIIMTSGNHTKIYDEEGQRDGYPSPELPNIFYVTKYEDIDQITRYFLTDPIIAKKCFTGFDETLSFMENVSRWLLSTQGYVSIPIPPKPTGIPKDVLDFGYYHMTHINPYTRNLCEKL